MKITSVLLGVVVSVSGVALAAPSPPLSGYAFLKPETQAMQDDELTNPGFFSVDQGRQLFNRTMAAGQSCASCHGAQGEKLLPQHIATYPVYDKAQQQWVRLQDRIKSCHDTYSGEQPLPTGHPDLLVLEAFVRHLAVGLPVNVSSGDEVQPLLKKGEALYQQRYGLIDMSCSHCHDRYTGQMIRGQKISQGMGNGFPAYRLDTSAITSLDQRIQQCLTLMRAEPFGVDSEEIKLLGAYIMVRSNGLKIESPAVRY